VDGPHGCAIRNLHRDPYPLHHAPPLGPLPLKKDPSPFRRRNRFSARVGETLKLTNSSSSKTRTTPSLPDDPLRAEAHPLASKSYSPEISFQPLPPFNPLFVLLLRVFSADSAFSLAHDRLTFRSPSPRTPFSLRTDDLEQRHPLFFFCCLSGYEQILYYVKTFFLVRTMPLY